MNRAAVQTAMRKIEEARNDNWNLFGPRELDLYQLTSHLAGRVGSVAHGVIRVRSQVSLDGKDALQCLTYELAHTAALCIEMMEVVDAEYAKLEGPRIRDFQQVAIGED